MTNVEDLEESVKKLKLPKSEVYPQLLLLADMQDHFDCGRCGKCCREQHPVCVKYHEIKDIANHLGISFKEFKEQYTDGRRDEDRLFLKWDAVGGCCFLVSATGKDENGLNKAFSWCLIYEVRPKACRVYPFFTFNNIQGTTVEKLHLSADCPYIKGAYFKRLKQIRDGELFDKKNND